MVLKVAKKTSNTLLAFVGQNPTYVSFNTREGEQECQKFFPYGYVTGSEEPEEDEEGDGEEEPEVEKTIDEVSAAEQEGDK